MFLDSLGPRETLDSQVAADSLEILEMLDSLVFLVTLVFLQPPLWLRESVDPLVLKAHLVVEDFQAPLVVRDSQVSLVTRVILV